MGWSRALLAIVRLGNKAYHSLGERLAADYYGAATTALIDELVEVFSMSFGKLFKGEQIWL